MSGKDETLEYSALDNEPLAAAMEKNVQKVKETLGESTDLVVREMGVGGRPDLKAAILYIDGLADTTVVQDFIVRAVTSSEIISEAQERSPEADWLTIFKEYAVSVSHLEEVPISASCSAA